VAQASVEEIDTLNILQATLLAMRRAVDALQVAAEYALVDGNQMPGLAIPGRAIVAGDALEPAISAASILAKTARDEMMRAFDAQHPGTASRSTWGTARRNTSSACAGSARAFCTGAASRRCGVSSEARAMRITSPDNPVVRRLRRLADSARACRDAGRTLAEGIHVIEAALAAGVPVHTIATRGPASTAAAALVERVEAGGAPGLKRIELGAALYDAISPVEHGAGVLAEIAIPGVDESPLLNEDAVFLDAVQDPGNVGTLLRTAAAAGVRRVVLGPGSAYAWSRR